MIASRSVLACSPLACSRSRRSVCSALFLLGVLSAARSTFATEDPITLPAEVQTLLIAKDPSPQNIVASWSDGSASFTFVRSETPDFENSSTITYVGTSILSSPAIDSGTLNDGRTYYYQIYDTNAQTTAFSVAGNTIAAVGDIITIQGVGFSSNPSENVVVFEGGGTATNIVSSSFTNIQCEIPADVVSGDVVVISPNGTSTPVRKLFAIGANGTAFNNLQQLGVDSSHNVYVADAGTNDQVWKIDFATGMKSAYGGHANPVGLPRDPSGNSYSGNDTTGGVGTIWQHPLGGGANIWATMSTSGDPVQARALAIDPSGNNNGAVFLLDSQGGRIGLVCVSPCVTNKAWVTGISPTLNAPGGLVFDTNGDFFYTNGNTIFQRHADKSSVQSFGVADGVLAPAQLSFDEDRHLWVANRPGNNILRIRTDPMNRLVRTKIDKLTSPRGVVFDRDPVTNRPYIYVADQTHVYRFRLHDTVYVDVKVLNETLLNAAGTATNKTQSGFTMRVTRDFNRLKAVLEQADIQPVLRGVTYISDPNSGVGNHINGTLSTDFAPAITGEERTLLGTSRAASNRDINVYYIHNFVDTGNPPVIQAVNGFTYTNDYSTDGGSPIDNLTRSALVMARYSTANGSSGAIDTTLTHEMGHFLLDNFADQIGPGEHHGSGFCGAGAPLSNFLMYKNGCLNRWTITPDEKTNMRTNTDEGAVFVELF